jgi:hypothetical protein
MTTWPAIEHLPGCPRHFKRFQPSQHRQTDASCGHHSNLDPFQVASLRSISCHSRSSSLCISARTCVSIVGELRPSSLAICPTVFGLRERESVRPRGPVLMKSDGSTAGLLFRVLKTRRSIRVDLDVRPCWTNCLTNRKEQSTGFYLCAILHSFCPAYRHSLWLR